MITFLLINAGSHADVPCKSFNQTPTPTSILINYLSPKYLSTF